MGLQHNAINENEQSMRMTQHCTHKKRYIEGSLQEQNLQKQYSMTKVNKGQTRGIFFVFFSWFHRTGRNLTRQLSKELITEYLNVYIHTQTYKNLFQGKVQNKYTDRQTFNVKVIYTLMHKSINTVQRNVKRVMNIFIVYYAFQLKSSILYHHFIFSQQL